MLVKFSEVFNYISQVLEGMRENVLFIFVFPSTPSPPPIHFIPNNVVVYPIYLQ